MQKMNKLVTHYDNLQISRNANPSIIRAAFKTLSQKLHPDKHQEDSKLAHEKYHLIKHAYEVLSDPEARENYDLWIENAEIEKYSSDIKAKQLFNFYTFKEKKAKISIIV